MAAGIKTLIALAFCAAVGILLVILACSLPQYNNWLPLLCGITYLLSPVPNMIGNHIGGDGFSSGPSTSMDVANFMTSCIVISGYGIPIVLSDSGVIEYGASVLTIIGNTLVFVTIAAYYALFGAEEW